MYLRVKLNKPSSSEEGCRLRALPRAPRHIYIGEWLFKGSWKLICPKSVVFLADGLKSLRSSPYVLLPPWQIRRIYNGILHAEVWKLLAWPLRTAGLRQAFGVTAVHIGLEVLRGGDGGRGTLASILWKSMLFFPFRNNPALARSTCNSQSSLTASCFFSAEQSPRKRCCPCTDLGLRSHQSWLILVWRLQERRLRTVFSGLNFFSGSARWFSAISVNFLEVLNAVRRQSCLLNPSRSLLSV